MKKCSKCGLEKENIEFSDHHRLKDQLKSWCKICIRTKNKTNYQNNPEKYLSRAKENRIEKRKWYNEVKSTLKCEKCGENHISTLDFHHIDPKKKEFPISRVYFSKEKILEEIKKCIVLCSNCHRKLHWDERNNTTE